MTNKEQIRWPDQSKASDLERLHKTARAALILPREIMAISKNDKHKEYIQYAEHCVKMASIAPDRESRVIHREMAAEWMKLADAVPSNSRSGLSNGKSEHGLEASPTGT
jgi:hypothetical protein